MKSICNAPAQLKESRQVLQLLELGSHHDRALSAVRSYLAWWNRLTRARASSAARPLQLEISPQHTADDGITDYRSAVYRCHPVANVVVRDPPHGSRTTGQQVRLIASLSKIV